MSELLAVELGQDAAALFLAVDVAKHVQRLHDAAEFGERASQRGRAVFDLQNAHDGAGMDPPELERSGQAQQVFPVPLDELDIDAMAREAVEYAVVGGSVDAPEAGVADIGKPWAELVAQEPKQSEHRVCISCGVGHDFGGIEVGLLLEQQSQDEQAVAQDTRHHDGVQPGELVGDEVVVVMPRPAPKYFGLGPAWMALLGATKRMPSAEATSPLPQMWAIGKAFCAATILALAAAMVSGRTKFWLTQDSRARLSAG